MRYILQRELTNLANDVKPVRAIGSAAVNRGPSGSSSSSSNSVALPPPISPIAAREADGDTFCAEGAWFKDQVVKSSVITGGWHWFDDAPPGSLKYCDHFNCHKYGYRANGALKSLDILVSNMLFC
jgi:hypothetical protein